MTKSEELIQAIEAQETTDFVTARFGKGWPEYAKENLDIDTLIRVAHKNGRMCILFERAIKNLID